MELTDVSAPSQGGSAVIGADGKSIQYDPAPGFSGEETFTYVAGDGQGGSDLATVTLQVIHSWHSVWNANDVDGNFLVTPRDVLLIINEINRAGSHWLGAPPNEYAHMLDTDGDGNLSPRDSLKVINEINDRLSPDSEGEADIPPHGSDWEGLVMLLAEDAAARRKR